MPDRSMKAAILIVSTTAAQDPSTDRCSSVLRDVFQDGGAGGAWQWEVVATKIVGDVVEDIQQAVAHWADGGDGEGEGVINAIITTGGTGFAATDVTPEVRRPRAVI